MFIKKIFNGQVDESVHRQFVRFGKGIYPGRAVTKITKQPDKIKIGTSFEMANDMVEFIAELGGGKVSGIVLSREDISKTLHEKGFYDINTSKKAGIFVSIIEQDCSSNELKELLAHSYACLLDIESQGISLKSKKKLPKPGKSGDLKIDDKFCQVELDVKFWPKVKEEFAFDVHNDFKKMLAVHTYVITDIVMPKGEKDFEKIRILAKRKGKIKRKITLDKNETLTEKDFEA
jgi:hypothetical protein